MPGGLAQRVLVLPSPLGLAFFLRCPVRPWDAGFLGQRVQSLNEAQLVSLHHPIEAAPTPATGSEAMCVIIIDRQALCGAVIVKRTIHHHGPVPLWLARQRYRLGH